MNIPFERLLEGKTCLVALNEYSEAELSEVLEKATIKYGKRFAAFKYSKLNHYRIGLEIELFKLLTRADFPIKEVNDVNLETD